MINALVTYGFNNKEIFLKYLTEPNTKRTGYNYIQRKYPLLYNEILNYNYDLNIKCISSRGRNNFAQKLHNYIFNIKEIPNCKICNNIVTFFQFGKGYNDTCSKKCGNLLGQKHIKKNLQLSHKVSHYTQKEGYKNTFNQKIINTCKDKLKKFNILDINTDKYEVTLDCKICGNIYTKNLILVYGRIRRSINPCEKCVPLNANNSKSEQEIRDFIESLNIQTKKDRKILDGNEIDIYIPEKKLAIEFNGIYWHSELYKDKQYHLNKTKLCNEKGIKLIHVYEDDWNFKKNIIKSRLKNELGLTEQKIYARKTQIKEVDSKTASAFLNKNHLQGKVNGSIRYGLYHNNDLVSLMTFSKKRKNLGQISTEGHFELLRFCNILNTSVIGGASKLFKHFLKEIKPTEVISYALVEWTNGSKDSLYDNLGFKEVGHTGLSYWWVVDGERKNRFNYRKDKLVIEGFDSNKTEIEIMNSRGYYRLFGCGNFKFKYYIK